MGKRIDLQKILETILGSTHVYFQPPANVKIQYPAIVYEWDSADTKFADNAPYMTSRRYKITLIDPDPDSLVSGKIAMLPMCVFDRHFTTSGLYHDNYNLYY